MLSRNPQGQLVNGDGLPILSDGNRVTIPPGVPDSNIRIHTSGNIAAGKYKLGQLSLVTFDDNQKLQSESGTYFRAGDAIGSTSKKVTVIQGARELSNAHPVSELISLIIGSRHFEAAQRAIRTMSDTIQESMQAR